MSRILLSLVVLGAAFTLILGTTDAQARHCWSRYRNHDCCQSSSYRSDNCFNRRTVTTTCQQSSRCAPRATCRNVGANCCVAEADHATLMTGPSNNLASEPEPVFQEAAPGPPPAPSPEN